MQELEDKPWRNEELRNLEEGLSKLREDNLQKTARSYKAATAVGCDGVHAKVPLTLSRERKGPFVEFLKK